MRKLNDTEDVAGKAPGFYIYPADLERELAPLPATAQAIWVRMLCRMHWAPRRGFLEHTTGEGWSDEDIARLVGLPVSMVSKMVYAMEHRYGTFSRDDKGIIFNRRMVRDTDISNKRRAAGKMGGNPNLVGSEINQSHKQTKNLLNQIPNQIPTPSSSSSFSTSKTHTQRAPLASDQTHKPSEKWEQFRERYPRKQHMNQAAQAYVSVVTGDTEAQVFACLERYLDSDEVARGVVQNPEKWLFEQAADGWAGMWQCANGKPKPAEGPTEGMRLAEREYQDSIRKKQAEEEYEKNRHAGQR